MARYLAFYKAVMAVCTPWLMTAAPAAAQVAATPPAPVAADLPRKVNFVTPEGQFVKDFTTLGEIIAASKGNLYNAIAKKSVELVWMNARCDIAAPITYSMTWPDRAGIDGPVKTYLAYRAAHTNEEDEDDSLIQSKRVLIDAIRPILAETWFKQKAACDPVPMLLSTDQGVVWLENEDAQNPLIGVKLNDGRMVSDILEDNPFADRVRAGEKDPGFLVKYGTNRFNDAQQAVNAALLQKTKYKLVIYDGQKIAIYEFGNFQPYLDLKGAAFEAQFDVFKKAKLRKGWTVIAVVLGQAQVIKISDPAGR
jgi:hypothetical protein